MPAAIPITSAFARWPELPEPAGQLWQRLVGRGGSADRGQRKTRPAAGDREDAIHSRPPPPRVFKVFADDIIAATCARVDQGDFGVNDGGVAQAWAGLRANAACLSFVEGRWALCRRALTPE